MVIDMLNYACVLCPCHSHIWGVLRALWLYLINLWIPLPCKVFNTRLGFPDDSAVKNLPANVGDIGNVGLLPRSGRSPGGGNCNPLQYSCLENPMDRGVWKATVQGVVKSWTRLSDWACTHAHTLAHTYEHSGTSLCLNICFQFSWATT